MTRRISVLGVGFLLAASALSVASPTDARAEGSSSVSPRIVGGSVAPEGSWPSVAALVRAGFGSYNGYFCAGSLISGRWVLTAAHCVVSGGETDPPFALDVVVGRRSLNGSGGERIGLDRVVPYPAYDAAGDTGDLALLRLERTASAPVRAVVKPSQASYWEPGDPAFAAGWGSTVAQPPEGTCGGSMQPPCPDPSYPNDLREVEIGIVADATCTGEYPGLFDPVAMVCAGIYPGGGKDSCQGDSGGPLEVQAGSERVLVGVVSSGSGCAQPNFMGLYARLGNYRRWIGYYAARLSASRGRLGFGRVRRGGSRTRTLTFSGVSSLPATVKSYEVRGRGFRRSGGTCGQTIQPDASCTVKIRFAPRRSGTSRGHLALRSPKGIAYRWIKLSG